MGAPKITYNTITVDFPDGAGAQNLLISSVEQIGKTQAVSGVQKYLHFYRNRFISFTLPYYHADFEAELLAMYDYQRTGNSVKLILDSEIGLYIPFEGKSGNTSDELAPTFARTHGGTDLANVVDAYTGLVTSVATGIQRFEAGNFGKAATLIEGAHSGNLILNSEDFSDANWTKSSVVVNSNLAVAPDGTLTADKLTFTGISTIYFDTSTAIGTDDCCFSVWLKTLSDTETGLLLYINNDAAGVKTSANISVNSTWQRFSIGYASIGADANNWRFQIGELSGSAVVFAWGAQCDVGKIYPTSYIKSNGAPPNTRQEETLYYELDDDNIDMNEFTISFWFKVPYDYDEHDDDDKAFIWLSETEDTNRAVSIIHLIASNQWEIRVYDYENNVGAQIVSSSLQFTADTWTHLAITFDNSGNNGLRFYGNGAYITVSSNTPFTPSAFDRLFVGMRDSTIPADHIDGLIDDLVILKRVLTADEILDYYNSGNGWGFKKNIWDDVYLKDFNYTTQFANGARRIIGTNLQFEEKLT